MCGLENSPSPSAVAVTVHRTSSDSQQPGALQGSAIYLQEGGNPTIRIALCETRLAPSCGAKRVGVGVAGWGSGYSESNRQSVPTPASLSVCVL